jgi:hypothetical protein
MVGMIMMTKAKMMVLPVMVIVFDGEEKKWDANEDDGDDGASGGDNDNDSFEEDVEYNDRER